MVVGSGIMGDKLSQGNVALALLANTLATGAGLVVLIATFGPLSGAHFNPAVTLVAAARGQLSVRDAVAYVSAQVGGAFAGVAAAHAMFGEALFSLSTHVRSGTPQLVSEVIATFGLLLVVSIVGGRGSPMTPFVVGAYISSAYWFTASTSFANPAVTLARAATNSFAGIRPADVPGFIVAQAIGAAAAAMVSRWLLQGSGAPRKEEDKTS